MGLFRMRQLANTGYTKHAPIGGYLKSYLSLPGLTRASTAVTCSRTALA